MWDEILACLRTDIKSEDKNKRKTSTTKIILTIFVTLTDSFGLNILMALRRGWLNFGKIKASQFASSLFNTEKKESMYWNIILLAWGGLFSQYPIWIGCTAYFFLSFLPVYLNKRFSFYISLKVVFASFFYLPLKWDISCRTTGKLFLLPLLDWSPTIVSSF